MFKNCCEPTQVNAYRLLIEYHLLQHQRKTMKQLLQIKNDQLWGTKVISMWVPVENQNKIEVLDDGNKTVVRDKGLCPVLEDNYSYPIVETKVIVPEGNNRFSGIRVVKLSTDIIFTDYEPETTVVGPEKFLGSLTCYVEPELIGQNNLGQNDAYITIKSRKQGGDDQQLKTKGTHILLY